MGHLEAIGLTLTACIGFGIAHSLLILRSVKTLAIKLLGEQRVQAFYRLAFTIASIVTTIITVYLILQIQDVVLYKGPLWWRVLMHTAEVAGLIFASLAFKVIDLKEFLGLRQAIKYIQTGKTRGDIEGLTGKGFVAEGVYGIVRHPLYFAGIIIFASQPTVTRNWLVVSILAIIYFVFGSWIEEKRLLKNSEAEYRRYMNDVPMLIPFIKSKS